MSRIEQLISEIEAYIDECKPQPFSNNKRNYCGKGCN